MTPTPLPPIQVTEEHFRELDLHLISLLKGITDDEWHHPTPCSEWTVKDIAAHLLDGSLRRLSLQRDGYRSPREPQTFASDDELAKYHHRHNAIWTRAADRLSPRLLIELIEIVGPEYAELMGSLDPMGQAVHAVTWAGEAVSLNWFDVARELSEKWTHQQHLREAVGAPNRTMTRRLYGPVLETFIRVLPYTYRRVQAPEGTCVQFNVTGEAGGKWDLVREANRWTLTAASGLPVASRVTVPQEAAWLLFTKKPDSAAKQAKLAAAKIEGHEKLGRVVLEAVAMVA